MALTTPASKVGDLDMESSLEASFLFDQLCLSLRGFDALDEREFQNLQEIDLVSKSRQLLTLKRKLLILKGRVQKPTSTSKASLSASSIIRLRDVESTETIYFSPLEQLLTQSSISSQQSSPFSSSSRKSAHDHLIDAIVSMRLLNLRHTASPDPLILQPISDQLAALPGLRSTLENFLTTPTDPSGLRLGQAKAATSSLGQFERLATKNSLAPNQRRKSTSSTRMSASRGKTRAVVRLPVIKPPRQTLAPQTTMVENPSLLAAPPMDMRTSALAGRKPLPVGGDVEQMERMEMREKERERERDRLEKERKSRLGVKGSKMRSVKALEGGKMTEADMEENARIVEGGRLLAQAERGIGIGRGEGDGRGGPGIGLDMRENSAKKGPHHPVLKPKKSSASVLGELAR